MDNIILACKLMFISLMVPIILGTIVGIIVSIAYEIKTIIKP